MEWRFTHAPTHPIGVRRLVKSDIETPQIRDSEPDKRRVQRNIAVILGENRVSH